jgi:hypothetical protein
MNRRGGILLEVMLSMAIFVAAAAFVLSATRNVFNGLERSNREQQAVDLARSKMAELDAGLISIMDLRGSDIRRVGSIDRYGDDDGAAASRLRWIVDVSTQRTAYRNLTLVELTVREDRDGADVASNTLRQIVRLREQDVEEYEPDDLLEGLSSAGVGGGR